MSVKCLEGKIWWISVHPGSHKFVTPSSCRSFRRSCTGSRQPSSPTPPPGSPAALPQIFPMAHRRKRLLFVPRKNIPLFPPLAKETMIITLVELPPRLDDLLLVQREQTVLDRHQEGGGGGGQGLGGGGRQGSLHFDSSSGLRIFLAHSKVQADVTCGTRW